MQQFSYTIQDPYGIHARPAGQLFRMAREFDCTVTVQCKGQSCSLKELMHFMALGIMQGDTITVQAEGKDEAECIAKISKFLTENV